MGAWGTSSVVHKRTFPGVLVFVDGPLWWWRVYIGRDGGPSIYITGGEARSEAQAKRCATKEAKRWIGKVPANATSGDLIRVKDSVVIAK